MKGNGHAEINTGAPAAPRVGIAGGVIRLGTPRPLLEPEGTYHATCLEVGWAWTRRFKRNQMRFVFDSPLDYYGPTYPGKLCAFCPLGREPGKPYAACGGKFFQLW
jgi:hypothetical protein